MSAIVERLAVRLFWKSEHLDPSDALNNASESEWLGQDFPERMSERDRKFWRLLATDAIEAMRDPTEEMLAAGDSQMPQIAPGEDITTGYDALAEAWPAMIDAALGRRM